MADRIGSISQRQAAKIAGIAYVVIIVLAGFFYQGVQARLREDGDAVATVSNIADSEGLFRVGLAALIVVFVADIVVGWALYVFLRPVGRELSLITAVFRWIYAGTSAVGVLNLLVALQLVRGEEYLSALDEGSRNAQAMVYIDAFNHGWTVGIVCFGIHLLLLGYVIFKSNYVPRIIGIFLIVAAAGYLVDSFVSVLVPDGVDYTDIFWLVPGVLGEFSLTGWLLVRGGKNARPGEQARAGSADVVA